MRSAGRSKDVPEPPVLAAAIRARISRCERPVVDGIAAGIGAGQAGIGGDWANARRVGVVVGVQAERRRGRENAGGVGLLGEVVGVRRLGIGVSNGRAIGD